MQTMNSIISYPLLISWFLASLLIVSPDTIALEVGDEAPDFTLPSTLGDSISMQQFKGRKYVLIEFYSLDFNPT